MTDYLEGIAILRGISGRVINMIKRVLMVALITYILSTTWRESYAIEYTKTFDVDKTLGPIEIVGFAEIMDNLHDVYDLDDLPESLSVIYGGRPHKDLVVGKILGPNNYVRATFLATIARYDKWFQVKILEEPYPIPTYIDPIPYLQSIMIGDVYYVLAVELRHLLKGSGCYKGYWIYLRGYVNTVKDWYQRGNNMQRMKPFVVGEYANSKCGRYFREFLEMFIESDNLDEVEACCKRMDKGWRYCESSNSLPRGGVYSVWKDQYKTEL